MAKATRKDGKTIREIWPEEDSLSLGHWPQATDDDQQQLGDLIGYWRRKTDQLKWVDAESWFLNQAFYAGNPYNQWRFNHREPASFGTVNPLLDNEAGEYLTARIHENFIVMAVKENVSLLTDADLRPRVEPVSGNIADEDASTMAEAVFNVVWERMKMPYKQRAAAELMCMMPSYIETVFEETDEIVTVPKVKKIDMGENPIDPDRRQYRWETEGTHQVPMQDLKAHVWSAFHVSYDPRATDEEGSEKWIMRSYYESLPLMKEKYNSNKPGYLPKNLDRVESVGREQFQFSPLYHAERVRQMITHTDVADYYYDTPHTEFSLNNQVIITKVDVAPTSDYPKGRTLVVANNVLIYAGDAMAWHEDYPRRWHTYVPFRFWRNGNKHAGMALCDQLVKVQKKINAIDTLIQLNREHGVLQGFFIPIGSEVNEDDLDGIAPRVKYRGAVPSLIPRTPMPIDHFKEKEDLIDYLMKLSKSTVPLSQAGSNVRANTMLQTERQDNLRSRSSTILDFEASLEAVAQNILIDVSLYVRPTEEPTMRAFAAFITQALSRHSDFGAVEQFSGEDLRDNIRIKLDLASSIYESPEAQEQKAVKWLQFAGSTQSLSPGDKYKVAEMMGLRGLGPADQFQVRLVKRLVNNVISGEFEKAIPLPDFHDPFVFSDHLAKIIADTNTFITYPEEVQDKIRELWDLYSALFRQVLEAQAAQAAEQAEALAATEGEGAAPGAVPEEPEA